MSKSKKIKTTLSEEQISDLKNKFMTYIEDKEVVVAFELIREFTDLLGDTSEEVVDNVIWLLKGLESSEKIEISYVGDGSVIGMGDIIYLKKKSK